MCLKLQSFIFEKNIVLTVNATVKQLKNIFAQFAFQFQHRRKNRHTTASEPCYVQVNCLVVGNL